MTNKTLPNYFSFPHNCLLIARDQSHADFIRLSTFDSFFHVKIAMSTVNKPAGGNIILPRTDYEIIDMDPYFSKVIRYFRGSDIMKIALFTASGPLVMATSSYFVNSGKSMYVSARYLRASTFLGFVAGFTNAYATSCLRFQGGRENSREVARDRYETKLRLSQGKSVYGIEESELPEWTRRVAARNSTNSFHYMAYIPWFNMAKHEFHGVSLDKYYEIRPGEESWGFNLTAPGQSEKDNEEKQTESH